MIVQISTYIDYNGIERNEQRYFKMIKPESEEQNEIQQENDNQSV